MPITKPPSSSPSQADVEVGLRLKRERERLHWTADKAAEVGGVSRTAQYNYEAAVSAPDTSYLLRVRSEGLDALYVVTGARERQTPGITDTERELLDRYNALPPKLRRFVEDAALLSFVAYSDRRTYHEDDEAQSKRQPAINLKRSKVENLAGRDLSITAPAKKPKR